MLHVFKTHILDFLFNSSFSQSEKNEIKEIVPLSHEHWHGCRGLTFIPVSDNFLSVGQVILSLSLCLYSDHKKDVEKSSQASIIRRYL